MEFSFWTLWVLIIWPLIFHILATRFVGPWFDRRFEKGKLWKRTRNIKRIRKQLEKARDDFNSIKGYHEDKVTLVLRTQVDFFKIILMAAVGTILYPILIVSARGLVIQNSIVRELTSFTPGLFVMFCAAIIFSICSEAIDRYHNVKNFDTYGKDMQKRIKLLEQDLDEDK